MQKKWDAIRGNAGFFVTMAVCLLVIGISGYFLLTEQNEPEHILPSDTGSVTAPASTPEARPLEEPQPLPENAEAVEVISSTPVEVEAPPLMPEVEIDDTPVVAEAPRLIVSPLQGEVLAAFSIDQLAYDPTLEDWRTHDGVDISAKPGTTVLAACSGTVLSVDDDPLMGTTVVISHDGGYETTYSNLQAQPNVEAGDNVSAGQIIGAVGTTAAAEAAQSPHLHFSVTKDGEAMDPDEFLNS